MYDDLVLRERSIFGIVVTGLVFGLLAGACFAVMHWQPTLYRPLLYLPTITGAIGLTIVALKLANQRRWTISKNWVVRFGYWNKQELKQETSAFECVSVAKFQFSGDRKNGKTYFDVELRNKHETLLIKRLKDYFAARRLAETISRKIELDLMDSTEDPPQRRDHRELDIHLTRLLKRQEKGKKVTGVTPPRLTIDEGSAMVALLPRNLACPKVFGCALILLGLSAVAGEIHLRYGKEILILAWLLLGLFAFRQQRIAINNGRLVLSTVLGITFWRKSIPLNELEELFVVESTTPLVRLGNALKFLIAHKPPAEAKTFAVSVGESGILARSDRYKIKSQTHLHKYEADYLLQTLEYWIVRQRTTGGKMDAYSRRAV